MARFGNWNPLASNWAAQPRMTTPDIVCLHTIVGTVAGTDAMWRRTGYSGTFSHFGLAGDGSCTQWQDTDFRGAANYNGNHRIISVECADLDSSFAKWNTNDGSAVPAFTGAQCETLAQLIATMCRAHNIPCVLIPDAKPGRRGIGYHRLGVPGYMVPGAEQWSTAQGKVCPGNRRIAQIPGIISRAQAILGGAPTQEDDMPLTDADYNAIADRVWHFVHPDPAKNGPAWAIDRLAGIDYKTQAAIDGIAGLPGRVAQAQPTAQVNVDAGAVAAALAGNANFLAAVAKAVNDDAARRGAA